MFAIKGGRFITHMKKLRGVETALANLFPSSALALREKIGSILWHLPPNVRFDAERLSEFFVLLRRDARLIGDREIDNQARDVFVYFDNDAKVRAPFDAIRLTKRLTAEC